MSGPRIGELFAGYGGLGMGVQAALGGDIAWYSEIDKGALKILAHRFPDGPNIGDITTVDWSQVEPVDILTGGSPCQDLSHAGKRAGMTDGTRSNLWVAMREAIAQLRPSLVIWENVRGAYSAEADSDLVTDPRLLADTRRRDGQPVLRALGRVLGDLSELGYDAGWHGLRAADVGAPHGRFRVFVVAYAASDSRWFAHGDGGVVADSNGGVDVAGRARTDQRPVPHGDGRGAPAALLPTPATSDTNGPGQHGDGGLDLRTAVSLMPTPTSRDHKDGQIRREPHRPAKHGGGDTDRGPGTPDDANLWIIAQRGQWGDYADAIMRWEQILGRPAPPPTMTSTKGNPQLSPAFVEWLMGLPAGWVTDAPGITRNEALKALGNGVVPQQADAAARWLLAHIASERAA